MSISDEYDKQFSLSFLHELFLPPSGDIELNPGPYSENCVRFFYWNFNSICARKGTKISLIEMHNSMYKYDVISLSETMLDSKVCDEIFIHGFNKEIFRNNHPSNAKVGWACMYFREGLPIIHRKDHVLLQESIVAEVNIGRRKIFMVTIYRNPSRNREQFEAFMGKTPNDCDSFTAGKFNCYNTNGRFQLYVFSALGRGWWSSWRDSFRWVFRNKQMNAIDQWAHQYTSWKYVLIDLIVANQPNFMSSQLWEGGDDHPEGIALDEFLETNKWMQLINEPTNIRREGMFCIDLIVPDQPNLFVESGAHPSLDVHCQHQLVYGKLNLFKRPRHLVKGSHGTTLKQTFNSFTMQYTLFTMT